MSMQISPSTLASDNFHLYIYGETKAVARLEKQPDGGMRIIAPPRVFKVAPLETMAGQLVSLHATELGISRDSFSVETGFNIDVRNQCQVVVIVNFPEAIDPLCSDAIISRYLSLIKNHDTISESLLPLSEINLKTETIEEMKAAASAMLSGCGGTPITTPATIYVGSTLACQLKGTFASRPDLSNLEQEAMEFLGRFDGFRLKKRCIFIDTEEEQVQVYWELEEQLGSIMDLAKNPKSLLRIFVKKTVDQRGQPVYSFDKWKYDQPSISSFEASCA